ncbi:MAG: VWA domain-containing protein [Candidatus Lokiarchaeota archaeon]|nr:VWA domain-containing protein [Candidatus Lokiarchaeota archaeon]
MPTSPFTFPPYELARLFSSSDIKRSTLEIVLENLIQQGLAGKVPTTGEIGAALKKLGVGFDPVAALERYKLVKVDEAGHVQLHPIVSEDLNLWPHLLEILRNRFGIRVSKRMQDIGRYLKYLDTLPAQANFLVQNMNVEREIVVEAIKGLFAIHASDPSELMSLQEALRFYKNKERISDKAVSALKTLSENMHLLTQNDMVFLKESMLTIDKIAAQTEAVKQEFTRFSVSAFLTGIIKFDDILEFENTDELTTLSLLMRSGPAERLKVQTVDADDPVSALIRRYLQRDLPRGRRKAIIHLVASFFREFFMREGLLKDLNALVRAFFQKDFDVKGTLFSTMKKMQIWTPVYKQRVKASSRNLILVNDLSGSMIASYIGQVELFQGLIDALDKDMESEIVFLSFSNDTFAINHSCMSRARAREEFLGLLTENTMGMTDINAVLEALLVGKPARGDPFKPPRPEETIVFFVSDLQETIGGRIDFDLAERVIKSCRKFYLPVPRDNYNKDNYQVFLGLGAVPVLYENVIDIPGKILKLMAYEVTA